MTDLREAMARAIVSAGYNPATAPAIADAVLAILPDAEALASIVERMMTALPNPSAGSGKYAELREQARAALANYRKGTGRAGV